MIRLLAIACFAGLPGLAIAEPASKSDLIRFTNGDQLHGTFNGIKDGPRASWLREDLAGNVDFSPGQIRQIVLRGGRPLKALSSLSHIALTNGDRIPGIIVAMDGKSVTLRTSFAGEIHVPREMVGMIAPSPLGGRTLYHGPFAADEWKMTTPESSEPLKPLAEAGPQPAADDTAPGRWQFSGSAWYWQNPRPGTALIRKEGMPDRSVLQFNASWKNRPSLAIAFHADFATPPPTNDPALAGSRPGQTDPSAFPFLFGNSYVLSLQQNFVRLCRAGFDENGAPQVKQLQSSSAYLRLPESGTALIELRCNRGTGEIALYIDDDFITQWSEGPGNEDGLPYSGKGGGLGFVVQSERSQVRISEIILAEWNGMPDSARSLQTDDQDIVLLANGTDRFSGKVTGFEDGKVHLQGRYGNFQLPLDELAEVRFARNGLAKSPEPSEDQLMVRLYPIGRISGQPVSGDATHLRLLSAGYGEFTVGLDSAVILDFNPSSSFLDDWDDQF